MATSPSVVGRYQVIRRLGVGGMGAVYLARDPELDRDVAIKLVKDDLTDDPDLRERFSREARSAARLRHPNIVTVFDIGEQDGCPFIAMEYVEGESLAEKIRRRAEMPLWQVLLWIESLCLGLAHAHKAGIVHRDIKPANTMVDAEGTLKIVDFGIARLAGSQMTREGVLVGTINYMSPEQILGRAPDHRADIFAVGAVLYETLAGQKAFPGTIPDGLFTRLCQTEPPALASFRPDLDPDIQAIVSHALAKDPDARYQDLTLMARDLAAVRVRITSQGDGESTRLVASTGTGSATAPMSLSNLPRPTDPTGTRPGAGDDDARRAARLRVEEEERQARLQSEEDARQARLQAEEAERQLRLRVEEEARLARLQAEEQERQARLRADEDAQVAAMAAARRVVDAARAALESGDVAGASELLDAVKPPAGVLDAEIADLRSRVAEQQRQRLRRVEIFTDAAELALSQRDFAKAASLVADAARLVPDAPAVRTLQAQVEAHEAEVQARARLQASVDVALRAANDALARGDLAAARSHVADAQRLDPGSWNVSSVAGRITQAARLAEESAQRQAIVEQQTRRQRSYLGVLAVVVLIVVLAVVLTRC